MTSPGDLQFRDDSIYTGDSVNATELDAPEITGIRGDDGNKFPPPILDISEDAKTNLLIWLDEWLNDLVSDQEKRQTIWNDQEAAYRAEPGPAQTKPFVGASRTTVPAIAMAVDPVHARLDIGVFKQSPVFQIKALKKSFVKYAEPLSKFVEYYQRHKLQLQHVVSPRLLECTKLGTCVLKTIYDRKAYQIKTYNKDWDIVKKEEVRYSGPRVVGVSIGNFLFPPLYESLQDCPIVAERIRTTFWDLKIAEASKKLANVDSIKGMETATRTGLEQAQIDASHHDTSRRHSDYYEIFEVWCDYDIDGNGLPEHLVITYHKDTRTILQLRYNWYFHQRKPYTVIPYTITSGSLYGIGLCEMIKPLQEELTSWQRMASNNAYLANTRMFIVKKGCGIEEIPRLYTGRCFFVDDPKSDFIPFASSDTYPSTIAERQNIFGLIEKRSGVSDYLTGRESPIIGSRATATSTVALIQEGTKRVEQVLENIRYGLSEVLENCVNLWIQYGVGNIADVVFGDDEVGQIVKEFFDDQVNADNVTGGMAFDLTATDAANNRQALQQLQLQIISQMMVYLEKVLAAGQAMIVAQQQNPALAAMIQDVAKAAYNLFKDLLTKYDVPNPESYLVDLGKYGSEQNGQPGTSGVEGQNPGLVPTPSFNAPPRAAVGPAVPVPALPGSGNGAGGSFSLPG